MKVEIMTETAIIKRGFIIPDERKIRNILQHYIEQKEKKKRTILYRRTVKKMQWLNIDIRTDT